MSKKQTKKPKISVITVVYNDVKHIEKTICSVLNQTYDNIEYIVIDGGSTDGTVDIIRKYEDKISYWVSEKDEGNIDAMNKGIAKASGSIINILNSGDFYSNNEIVEDIVSKFKKDNFSFILGIAKFIKEDGSPKIISNKEVTTTLKAGIFNRISHQAFFYKKSLHEEFGYYNYKDYKSAADGHFMYSVYYSKNHKKYLYDKILAHCLEGGISKSYKAILNEKKFREDLYGKRFSNQVLIIKYYLKKYKLGKMLYNIYLNLKYLLFK